MAFTSSYTDGLIQQSEYYYGTPDVSLTGSFSGSFEGNGSSLTNIPASGIVGLNLSQIASGSVTASISPDHGLHVNTDVDISGSLIVSASSHRIEGSTVIYSTSTPGLTIQSNSDTAEEVKIYDARIDVEDSGYMAARLSSNAYGSRAGVLDLRHWAGNVGAVITAQPSYTSYIQSSLLIGKTGTVNSSYAYKLDVNGDIKLGNGTDDSIEILGPVTASADISSSASSTASFGTYIGDGSQLTGVGGGSTDTGSLLTTASVSLNTITFTKGDGSTFPITVDTGSGGGGVPAGTVSGSAQITELGFVTSSATASFVLNSQTSSMSVATASYVEASNIDGTVSNALSSSHAQRSDATDTIDVTQGSTNTNRYVTFTSAINSDGALLADPGILYNPFSNTLTVANITGTASLASAAESVEYSNVNNKPTLISSSAQIATDISGAFSADSASFSTRITTNETDISTLTAATASYILASQTSSMTVLSSSFAVSASYAPSADAFPFVGDAVITGSLTVSGSNLTSGFRTDTRNVILGYGAGNNQDATNGPFNVMIGYESGYTNTIGDSNVCIGQYAGYALSTNASDENIFIGKLAGAGGTSPVARMSDANWNIGLGNESLLLLTSGDYNIGFGNRVMRNISSGQQNIGLGRNALYNVTSGDNNIGIGHNAGLNQTTGDGNITIGSGSLGVAGESNQLRIGNGNTITTISASLETGDIIFASTASAAYFVGDGSNITGVVSASYAVTASHALNAGGGTPTFIASGSTSASAAPDTGVVVEHSGSTAFSVIGDVGTLFSVDDDLNGMLFTANDISGFPVLQASASGEVYVGKTPQSLYTTAVISSTTAATTHSLCTLSTSSYDGAFFEYTAQSASNARAGNIMSTWNGTDIVYAETTTADIGRTSDLTTEVIISGSTARLVAYGANAGYKIKTIIKAI